MRTKILRTMAIVFIAAGQLFVSCGNDNPANNNNNNNNSVDPSQTIGGLKPTDNITAEVDSKIPADVRTIAAGQKPEATVTFSRFPVSVKEFTDLRNRIGKSPEGAIALLLMSYEMYRHDKNIGGACIDLVSSSVNRKQPKERLSELFYRPTDPYHRPYQIAAFLQGAGGGYDPVSNTDKGQNPTEPYTVRVRYNDYVTSHDYMADVVTLQIISNAHDTHHQVSLVKTTKAGEPSEGTYYMATSNGGVYSQVKKTNNFKGLKPFGK